MYSTRAANAARRTPAKQDCSVKTKKMEPIIGIDEEGASPTKSRSEATATDNQVRIAYWRQPMSKAMIHDKNSGKIYFARCFLECIKAILTESGQKKWSQLSESTRQTQSVEEPEQSDGNRQPSENCVLATANEQSDDT